MFHAILNHIRLLFHQGKKPFSELKAILGFMPRDLRYYRIALMHKSASERVRGHHKINNERLEFLGDAVLDAIVADIIFRRYPDCQEGFMTTLRSKLVKRDRLNRLAEQIGLDKLILFTGKASSAHNSYMNGNAFEAFVGAIYLDRGYAYCKKFMTNVILKKYVDLNELSKVEENYKSKVIEWCQRRQLKVRFEIISQQKQSDYSTPKFVSRVMIEDVYCGRGEGYSKKESHQEAARQAYKRITRNAPLAKQLLSAHAERAQGGTPG